MELQARKVADSRLGRVGNLFAVQQRCRESQEAEEAGIRFIVAGRDSPAVF